MFLWKCSFFSTRYGSQDRSRPNLFGNITGLTIVALGTSVPELVISHDAAFIGAGALAVDFLSLPVAAIW